MTLPGCRDGAYTPGRSSIGTMDRCGHLFPFDVETLASQPRPYPVAVDAAKVPTYSMAPTL